MIFYSKLYTVGMIVSLQRRLTRHGWWLVILLIPLILFARPILRGEVLLPGDILPLVDDMWGGKATPNNPLLSDVVLQFYPWQKFAATSLAHGEIPLWNHFILAGTPFLANDQSAIFEPLRFFTLLVHWPVEHAFLLLAVGRLMLFGFFTGLWLRRKGIADHLAVIGAGLAMLATPVVAWISYPLFATFVWLPLLLYGADELIMRPRRGGLILALGIAAQWLSGNVQISVYLLLTVLAYTLYVLRPTKRLWLRIGVAILLGTGLAAVQLWPAAEHIRQSQVYESGRGGYGDKNIWQAIGDGAWRGWTSRAELRKSINRLLPVVSPFIHGNPASGKYRFPDGDVYANFNELAGSIGTVGLLFALLGLVSAWRERLVRFAAGGSVLLLGMIAHAPVFELLNYLPIIQRTQTDRLRFLIVFFLMILAVFGIRTILERRVRLMKSVISILVGLSLIAILGWKFGVGMDWKKEIAMSVVIAVIVMIASAARLRPAWKTVIIGVAALATPFWLLQSFNTSVPAATLYPDTPVLNFLRTTMTMNDRLVSFDVGGGRTPLEPNSAMLWQLHDVRGYDVVRLKRYDELLDGSLMRSGSHVKGATTPGPIVDALAVRFGLVAQRDVAQLDPGLSAAGWKNVLEDERVRVYENPQALRRAYIATTVSSATSSAESLAAVKSPGFDPRQPVIETSRAQSIGADAEVFPASVVSETANTVSVNASSPTGGYLVLADTMAPGWTATVDGKTTDIVHANHAFRATVIPAGRHHVIFRYRPRSFISGSLITGVAFLTLLAISFTKSPRKRKTYIQPMLY